MDGAGVGVDGDQHGAHIDVFSGCIIDLGDSARTGRGQGLQKFHGLDYNNRLSGDDNITGLGQNVRDKAGHRCAHLIAATQCGLASRLNDPVAVQNNKRGATGLTVQRNFLTVDFGACAMAHAVSFIRQYAATQAGVFHFNRGQIMKGDDIGPVAPLDAGIFTVDPVNGLT